MARVSLIDNPRQRYLNGVAILVVIVLCSAAVRQWSEIYYRLHLFFVEYNCRLYWNHVGDGAFFIAYAANALLVLMTAIAWYGLLWFGWSAERKIRVPLAIALVLNLLAAVTVWIMHLTGILVTYDEWSVYNHFG